MPDRPTTVTIREVGLRDGLQNLARVMPTSLKVAWLRGSYEAGLREIEVGSFVPPKLLPQLADTGEVVAFAKSLPGATVSVLVPNLKGAERAIEAARLELQGWLVRDDADDEAVAGTKSAAFASDVAATLSATAFEAVAEHHREAPLSPGLPMSRARSALRRRLRSMATVERRDAGAVDSAISRLLDELIAQGRLARRGDALHDPGRGEALPAALLAAMDRLEAALSVPAPPALGEAATAAGCPPEGVRALQADGRIVRVGPDLAWSTGTFHRLAAAALDAARAAPLTPAAFRDATGTSRKYVLAILEDLDRRGILERTPEGHIPGPRAPRRDVEGAAAAVAPR